MRVRTTRQDGKGLHSNCGIIFACDWKEVSEDDLGKKAGKRTVRERLMGDSMLECSEGEAPKKRRVGRPSKADKEAEAMAAETLTLEP